MFKQAIAIASEYTRPVVISRRTLKGDCSSSIAAYVVLNEDSWIATAGHIIEQIHKLDQEMQQVQTLQAQIQALEADASIPQKEKRRRLKALGRPKQGQTQNWSTWWGRDGVKLVDAEAIRFVDIGVGRLEPFDAAWVSTYPSIKDPTTSSFATGTSLCKLGYPFHKIVPNWNDSTQGFELPASAVPPPLFPMEGMLCRFADVQVQGAPPPPFPFRWIETSTPGLKGQSGGPIFDIQGSVWAIQIHTHHYDLGFSPKVPGSRKDEREHQFLNCGRGVHPDTMMAFFDQKGISYKKTDY